jgi:hypothetical protein
MTPIEIKTKLTELFEASKEDIQAVRAYGEQVHALTIEYHRQRLESATGTKFEECGLIATINVNQSPVSLDKFITELQAQAAPVGRIIHEVTTGKIFIFSK